MRRRQGRPESEEAHGAGENECGCPLLLGPRMRVQASVCADTEFDRIKPGTKLVMKAEDEKDAREDELDDHDDAGTRQKAKRKVLQHKIHRNLVAKLSPIEHIEHDGWCKEEAGQQHDVAGVMPDDHAGDYEQEHKEAPTYARQLSAGA